MNFLPSSYHGVIIFKKSFNMTKRINFSGNIERKIVFAETKKIR